MPTRPPGSPPRDACRPQGRWHELRQFQPVGWKPLGHVDIDRPGSGVLEFYSKSSAVFKKKYNLSKLPAHKLRIDESCIEVSQTGSGIVQIVHAKKGPYSLQSSSDLSAWATALDSLQLNKNSDA